MVKSIPNLSSSELHPDKETSG